MGNIRAWKKWKGKGKKDRKWRKRKEGGGKDNLGKWR